MLVIPSSIPLKEKFQSYCWEFSLRTGTFFAGCVGLALGLVLVLECLTNFLNIWHFNPGGKSRIFIAIFGFMSLLFHGVLIYGTRIENPLLMLPYLLFSLASFVVMGAFMVYALIISYTSAAPTVSVLLTAGCVMVVVATFHIWVGIYSYYRELVDKLTPPPGFQLENLAFERESESDINSISEAQIPLTKSCNSGPVAV